MLKPWMLVTVLVLVLLQTSIGIADIGDPEVSGEFCGDGTCCQSEVLRPGGGDGDLCGDFEYAWTCAADCPAECGDDHCTHTETYATCSADCLATCGNDICESPGESIANCAIDCSVCGDRTCTGNETTITCAVDCAPPIDIDIGIIPYCGDTACDSDEDAVTCSIDCPAVCGDAACTTGETPADCATDCVAGCGNGICEPKENSISCSNDCGSLQEIVTFDQSIFDETIEPENSQQIKKELDAIGLTNVSIESIEAAHNRIFQIARGFNHQRKESTYKEPYFVTSITIQIQNNTNKNYTLEFIETIPKEIIQTYSPTNTQSQSPLTVIQEDPVLQFLINKLEAGHSKTITYTIPNTILTKEQAQNFPNPIITQYREISQQELTTIGCQKHDECTQKTCNYSRCIDQECYYLPQPPGTSCGPGQECNPNQTCINKNIQPYTPPTNLLNLPALILIIAIIVLAVWIIKEYIRE
ncbi:hypothetical protein KKE06_00625 [Candidatus Micrarchaeota archaeon]|nr:hypothetical protein [Candidatus Micrarchaeota archaeon]MBU1930307.1 hypothetical protein [Candidatus Micrarchaeota archaeon]